MLLRQAEQRLEKGGGVAPVQEADADTVQLVPRPTADVPKEDGGIRPAIKQQTAKTQAKVSRICNYALFFPFSCILGDEKEPLMVLLTRRIVRFGQ